MIAGCLNSYKSQKINCFFSKIYKPVFTVSEVLITLMVIGVIAGFVVPMIKTKIDETIAVGKIRYVYAELNSSYQVAIKKYGPQLYWGLKEGANIVDETGATVGYNPSENAS